MTLAITVLVASLASPVTFPAAPPDRTELAHALTFHASFDEKPDADHARGDGRIHTSSSWSPADGKPGLALDKVKVVPEKGRHGGALRFSEKTEGMVYFRAGKNVPWKKEDWSGTVSLWMRLDPDKDLPAGYSDPIQITDKKWNDAALFVDFTKDERPRHFRLGAFSDHAVWNPEGREWDAIPEEERPMVTVKKTPFTADRWTHVVFTFEKFNRDDTSAVASLYLDGKLAGKLTGRKQRFTWDPEKAAILLGLSYVGLMDDLAVFDRALSAEEVKLLHALPAGVKGLRGSE